MTQNKLPPGFLDKLQSEHGPIAQNLAKCLRPTFVAREEYNTLVWSDFSSIEARVLPWLSDSDGGRDVLKVFEDVDADPNAADLYIREGANIHGLTPAEVLARMKKGDPVAKSMRQEGKVAVLALGFGGGVGALSAMSAAYGLHFESDKAQHVVESWRSNNQWAVEFWKELNDAFFAAYSNPGHAYSAGRISYVYDPTYHGGAIFCALPCGRLLTYPNLKYRMVEKINQQTGETYEIKAMTYRKGYSWGVLWSGILAENVTQATAASILRAKLRKLDELAQKDKAQGYEPWLQVVGHVHDECITECLKQNKELAVKTLTNIMEAPLSWTSGLPLVADTQSHWCYTKAAG